MIKKSILLALAALALPAGANAQAPATPHTLGGASLLAAGERGNDAALINPARLADAPSSFSLPSITLGGGMMPFGPSYLGQFGERLDTLEKAEILERIRKNGGLSGTAEMSVRWLGLSYRNFAANAYTQASAQGALPAGLAEVVLYGNVGQSGNADSLDLGGLGGRARATTTFALSYGRHLPLELPIPGTVSVGATAKYRLSHFFADARDEGVYAVNDPVRAEADVRIVDAMGGNGFALDLGAAWKDGPWTVDFSINEAIRLHSHASNAREMRYVLYADADTSYNTADTTAVAQLGGVDKAAAQARLDAPLAPRQMNLSASHAFGPHSLGAGVRLTEAPAFGEHNAKELALAGTLRPLPWLHARTGMTIGDEFSRASASMSLNLGVFSLTAGTAKRFAGAHGWDFSLQGGFGGR